MLLTLAEQKDILNYKKEHTKVIQFYSWTRDFVILNKNTIEVLNICNYSNYSRLKSNNYKYEIVGIGVLKGVHMAVCILRSI